jgi:iron complex outermembrane receptor protein
VFRRTGSNGIDYVRATTADRWQAVNLQRLRFTGVEARVVLRPAAWQRIDLGYTFLNGAQQALAGLMSKYVFNYPSSSGVVSWQASLPHSLVMRTRVAAVNRTGRAAYALWDVYGSRAAGRIRPFLQLTNLTGANYQEVPGVVMPGRGVLGGIELVLTANRY